jgi:hypothetical protein
VSVVETAGPKTLRSVKVGRVPYGIVVDD